MKTAFALPAWLALYFVSMEMRRRWQLRTIAAAVLLSVVTHGQSRQTPSLVLRLPREMAPEKAVIELHKDGGRPTSPYLRTQKDIFEYPIPFRFDNSPAAFQADAFTTFLLQIFVPGFQVFSKRFVPADLTAPLIFEPTLVKLRTVPFEGLLADSAGSPVGGLNIDLSYQTEHKNCPDCIVSEWSIAHSTSASSGAFHFDIPFLSDDPFFGNYESGKFILASNGGFLRPATFMLQPSYSERRVVNRILPGTLVGKLGKAFLGQNKLPPNLASYHNYDKNQYVELKIDFTGGADLRFGSSSSFHQLSDDGSFTISLFPNKYSVSVQIVRGTRRDIIMIQGDVLIEENKSTKIEIP
jgi:hypothetical protein